MELNIIIWIIGGVGAIAALTTIVAYWIGRKPSTPDPCELDQDEWSHYQQYGEPK